MISFETTKEEQKLIAAIVTRAMTIVRESDIDDVEAQDLSMDITACHANGCPLQLGKLLNAPEGDFGHDVFGIRRYINRSNGKMDKTFSPRCAEPTRRLYGDI